MVPSPLLSVPSPSSGSAQPPPGLTGCVLVRGWAWPASTCACLLAAAALLLAGCATDNAREALPEVPRVSQLKPPVLPPGATGMNDEGGEGGDVISTPGRSDLIPTALDESDPLPAYTVPWLSFVNTPLQDVLQAIAGDAKLALSVVWDNPASRISRSSVSMSNLSGELTTVLNKLADSYGFYWRYKDGMLHIAADRQYVAPIPPVADLFESLPIMVKTLGGTDVFLDKSARMITFRAGSQPFAKIKNYLETIRKNRSLITYDTYIWEVILNDGSRMGIDWGAMPGNAPTTVARAGPGSSLPPGSGLLTAGLLNASSGGTGLALSFAGARFSMNLLLDFLRTQGTVNSLSQPKIQLLSGGQATLRDEIATTYVSRIGSASISAGTVIPGSIETSQVKTGVMLEVSGDVSDDTIYTDISLRVSDLLGMDSAMVSGSTISLPKTASREVKTHVRAKPGDTILLAGIQYDKLNNAQATGMGVVRTTQAEVMRSELIIVLRPRVKRFVHRGDERTAGAPVLPPSIPASLLLPQPVAQPVPQPVPQPLAVRAAAPAKAVAVPPGIYLQIGRFGDAANAELMRAEVDQRLGWRRDGGPRLHVVAAAAADAAATHQLLAGPFVDREVAENWGQRGQRIFGGRPTLVVR